MQIFGVSGRNLFCPYRACRFVVDVALGLQPPSAQTVTLRAFSPDPKMGWDADVVFETVKDFAGLSKIRRSGDGCGGVILFHFMCPGHTGEMKKDEWRRLQRLQGACAIVFPGHMTRGGDVVWLESSLTT